MLHSTPLYYILYYIKKYAGILGSQSAHLTSSSVAWYNQSIWYYYCVCNLQAL